MCSYKTRLNKMTSFCDFPFFDNVMCFTAVKKLKEYGKKKHFLIPYIAHFPLHEKIFSLFFLREIVAKTDKTCS